MKRYLLALILTLASFFMISAQDGPSTEQLKEANNPLASVTAVNLQNYYSPFVSGTDSKTNGFVLRIAQPFGGGRWLARLSVPVNSVFSTSTESESGFGNTNLFVTYSFVSKPKTLIGIGPYATVPGTIGPTKESWELGAALVAFFAPTAVVQGGGLITYKTDIAGPVETNAMAIQPFLFIQAGGGLYFRTAPIWTFDFENDNYNMPLGLGVGKVIVGKSGAVYNMFVEPQFSIYSKGVGSSIFQVYTALNMQL